MSVEELKLAFAYHLLHGMAHADEQIDPAEQALLDTLLPPAKLHAFGFLDADDNETERLGQARDAALAELPTKLELSDKLALLTTFLDMAIVDGHLDRSETSVLYAAADLLGISGSEFDAHLDTLTDTVDTIDLPEPEFD